MQNLVFNRSRLGGFVICFVRGIFNIFKKKKTIPSSYDNYLKGLEMKKKIVKYPNSLQKKEGMSKKIQRENHRFLYCFQYFRKKKIFLYSNHAMNTKEF